MDKYKWIDVSERLPSGDESWCLVYADGAMNCMMFYNERFYDPTLSKCHNINIDEITYWMPLPDKPVKHKQPSEKMKVALAEADDIQAKFKSIKDAV